eukprot:4460200-Amphidinium_carterae.1
MAALEQLVTNQYNIFASSPGLHLMEGDVRTTKKFNERKEFKNRQPYSAVEAFKNDIAARVVTKASAEDGPKYKFYG